jgi:hypothetical protein
MFVEMGIVVLFIALIIAIIWRVSTSRSLHEISPTTPLDNPVAPLQLTISSRISIDSPKRVPGAIDQSVDGG